MTTPPQQTSESAAPSRARGVALWVVQSVVAVWMLLAALGKFGGAEQIVATFEAIGFGDWLRYLVGALEVAGAAALLIPRLAGLAGLAFVALMAGAAVTQLIVTGGGVIIPLALLALAAVIAWGRRRSTTQLWTMVAGRQLSR